MSRALQLVVWLAAMLWSTAVVAAPASDWAEAEAAEARALRSELDALRGSLGAARASTKTAKAALRKEIDELNAKLTRLRVRNAQLERGLPQRERERAAGDQHHDLTDMLARMQSRLSDPPATLPEVVEQILAGVEHDGGLRVDPDAHYFDAHGKQRSAPILHIGRVAAVRWDDDPHALVGTPDGYQEAIGMPAAVDPHGDALLADVVLQDPDDPPRLDAFETTGWRAKMEVGGPIMWVLLVVGIIALLIILERTVALTWSAARWRREQRRFADAVRAHRANTLLDVGGWIAKPLVVAACARCPSCDAETHGDVEERSTQALMVMRERLLRRLSMVNITAGVAPLLGLLGTVTGMIHTFSVVTATGTSEPQQLAEGISQALLTTQFGLAIAIPAFLAHALLTRGARRILASAEQTVLFYLHGYHDHDKDHHHHAH